MIFFKFFNNDNGIINIVSTMGILKYAIFGINLLHNTGWCIIWLNVSDVK